MWNHTVQIFMESFVLPAMGFTTGVALLKCRWCLAATLLIVGFLLSLLVQKTWHA